MKRGLVIFGLWVALALAGVAHGQSGERLTLALRDVNLAEVMEMLARKARVNILLAAGVDASVSFSLYDVTVEQAIEQIAAAAGFAVERRDNSFFVLEPGDAGKYSVNGLTELRTFKVEYSDVALIEAILKNHLSELGKITTLRERKLLVVEDRTDFLERIEVLLQRLDRAPRQILIEAKIVEIQLRESESFGMDWAKLFRVDGGNGSLGTRGLADPTSPGLFVELVTPNVELNLNLLRSEGRLRTLSTPKLLAVENQEAKAVIGDRIGYKVTTTINQVTTESIEFLESGVILRVTPSVDGQGQVLLDIHPEVSTGSVSDDGIPSLSTTEVNTRMLVRDGKTIFIGGLIKRSASQTEERVPLLGDLPLIGNAFANQATNVVNTETIVLITPYILNDGSNPLIDESLARSAEIEQSLPDLFLELREPRAADAAASAGGNAARMPSARTEDGG